jgi:hypothetical protein
MSPAESRREAYPAKSNFLRFFIIIAMFAPAGSVRAHDAPSGWAYDMSCCSNQDCHPEPREVRATSLGWLITATGETIPYGDGRIHESKDGDFHRCANGAAKQDHSTRCLYVPPMGL